MSRMAWNAPNLPPMIGACAHCGLPLYVDQPVAGPTLDELAAHITPALAHVACAVDSRREH